MGGDDNKLVSQQPTGQVPPVPPAPAELVGGAKAKEMEPASATSLGEAKPVEKMEEIPTHVELEKKPELSGYIEKVEKEAELKKPIHDDYTQQVLMKSANPQGPVVTLPLTEEQVVAGLHRQVWESFRWLAEWCVRQIKVLHGRVKYKN